MYNIDSGYGLQTIGISHIGATLQSALFGPRCDESQVELHGRDESARRRFPQRGSRGRPVVRVGQAFLAARPLQFPVRQCQPERGDVEKLMLGRDAVLGAGDEVPGWVSCAAGGDSRPHRNEHSGYLGG